MNFVLITIDALSARHVGCYGYARDTTPFLDGLARDAVLFDSCYCQAIPTHPWYTSLYTGQYSITHGVVSHCGRHALDPEVPTLPQVLKRSGYTTCAVDDLPQQREWFGRGLDWRIDPRPEGAVGLPISAEWCTERAISWLRTHAKAPFFLLVHYWDPHIPYLPPERYRDLFYDGDPCDPDNHSLEGLWEHPFGEQCGPWFDQLRPGITDARYIRAMYDSEIRHAEDGIRDLLDALSRLGLADDTALIVNSDHGEIMHKHGIYFDHHGLYDDNLHVPLMLRVPGIGVPRARVPHLVQHIDIAPTLLGLAGIPVPDTMEGTSLVPYLTGDRQGPIHPHLVSLECSRMKKWALRTDQHKYILAREPDYLAGPMRELYDLAADPQELTNLAEERPELAAELESTLEGWIARAMERNGLTQDPVAASPLTLGVHWADWVRQRRSGQTPEEPRPAREEKPESEDAVPQDEASKVARNLEALGYI